MLAESRLASGLRGCRSCHVDPLSSARL